MFALPLPVFEDAAPLPELPRPLPPPEPPRPPPLLLGVGCVLIPMPFNRALSSFNVFNNSGENALFGAALFNRVLASAALACTLATSLASYFDTSRLSTLAMLSLSPPTSLALYSASFV